MKSLSELDNYTDVNTVNLRKSSLQNIKENAKKTKSNTTISADCCPPRPRSPDLAFTSAGEFVLNQVTFELPEGFRNAPLSQNAATCSGSLLPGAPPSLQPPPWQASLSWERGGPRTPFSLCGHIQTFYYAASSEKVSLWLQSIRELEQAGCHFPKITTAFPNHCLIVSV